MRASKYGTEGYPDGDAVPEEVGDPPAAPDQANSSSGSPALIKLRIVSASIGLLGVVGTILLTHDGVEFLGVLALPLYLVAFIAYAITGGGIGPCGPSGEIGIFACLVAGCIYFGIAYGVGLLAMWLRRHWGAPRTPSG